ncbi:protein-L-isoaspartate(D-aspartate) O-methyltransferase [Geoalkalibacter subterraneus]|uniref:Protein-L-isoaspartate O-methyltransferase n=1 Tax=Geoalkalibacter subterraneus TaxID=483547 RepID=A0A0B5FQS7_9BACT|nr:protein-L-isoaspartate(D-aspartate) O-methyltransferase [Geoalkalibacter subterraneus]AJF06465.1 protein-L-isoaspartate O-methyltransferase [Geoalkalibacter subterraneus]
MDFAIARRRMVEKHIKGRGVNDPLVLQAMLEVPRHLFVEEALQSQAYGDYPLPIGNKQTISQPYMVAYMTEALQLKGGENVLEIGTGSGYQAAVLARIAGKVFTVERIPELARRARRILDRIGAINVNIKVTDGTIGWEEQAPFDAIIVTAGAPAVPEKYLAQLAPGGRLVIPVGDMYSQVLKRFIKQADGQVTEESLLGCRFVPLVGRNGWREEGD